VTDLSDFPFRLPNYAHQAAEFERHRDDDARALLWQMRTGKTKSILDTVCYRHADRRDIDGLLVIAPNGVHVNWVRRQLPLHMWGCVDYSAHAYQSSEAHKQKHARSLEACLSYRAGLAVLAINSESLRYDKVKDIIKRFLKGRRVFLVADESHNFRSPGSKRTKTIRGLARKCHVRRILTGTMASNSPLAAFSQYEILEAGALGFTRFSDFESRFATFTEKKNGAGQTYRLLNGYVNQDELQASIARWSSVVLREDVDDMPALLLDEVTVALSEELHEHYRTLLKEYILEFEDGGEVDAVDGGVRLMKLQQILSGFVVDSAGELRELVTDEQNPRLQALLQQVEGSTGKNIIWCKYQEDIKRVVRALTAAGRNVVEYHGRIHSQSKRQAAIDAFMHDPKVTDFIGQPAAAGAGLDLSIAETVHWYSHTFDLIERDQAMERATQIGGKSIVVLDYVVPDTVDEYILKTLARKRSVSDELTGAGLRDRLLALFREQL
jgi:SNF2 family DNA or RNA helicase